MDVVDGPRHEENYFLLKADHFDFNSKRLSEARAGKPASPPGRHRRKNADRRARPVDW